MSWSAVSIPLGSAAASAETDRIADSNWIRKIKDLLYGTTLILPLTAPLRHNGDLDIARLAHYLLHDCLPEPLPPGPRPASSHKNLSDAMGARELGDGARHVLTFYYVRQDAQVSGKAHIRSEDR